MHKDAHPSGNRFPYELISLANGTTSVHSLADGETFHPVAGPSAEAEALYVDQLQLRQRLAAARRALVIWDIGLGAGGNAFTALGRLADVPGRVRLISFDRTLDALRFALHHARTLQYPVGFEPAIEALFAQHCVTFEHGRLGVQWQVQVEDFPTFIAEAAGRTPALPSPDAIFFDAFSPARNPEVWTLAVFENLFRALRPDVPCALATFSRSTLARVSMLLAGFFVGAGASVSGKEETTMAANDLLLIEKPLGKSWLQRARVSTSAEPLSGPAYRAAPLTPATWERLRNHPQFA